MVSGILLTHLTTGIEAWTPPSDGRTSNLTRARKLLAARLNAVHEGRANETFFARVPSLGPIDHARTYDLIAIEITEDRLGSSRPGGLDPDCLDTLCAVLRGKG